MPRFLRLLAVVVLVLASSQLLTAPTGAAQRTDPVVLEASAAAVTYAKQLVLTATVAPQPDAQVSFYAKALDGPDKLLGTGATGGDGKAKVTLAVNRTATYYAVLLVGGVATAQSASVAVVVKPTLKLTAVRVIGPVYHFNATVLPAADGIPIVLQRLVGKRWKRIEKDLTEDGELIFNAEIPANAASKWRLFVRGSKKYGESTSKAVRVIDY